MSGRPWTPGPWEVGALPPPFWRYIWQSSRPEPGGVLAAVAEFDEDGRVVSHFNRTIQEARANAHLIAAAPALAEELENLLLRADAMGWGDDELAPARAALAKARGEAP